MRRSSVGWMLAVAVAFAFAIPTLSLISSAEAKSAKSSDESSAGGGENSLSKEEQAKLKEHNKLRAEIMKVKYPASKDQVVSHIKGIKADDKKWVEETLPDKTFKNADDVMKALGWEVAPPSDEKPTASKSSKPMKGEKAPR